MLLIKISLNFLLINFLIISNSFSEEIKVNTDSVLGTWLSENRDGLITVTKVDNKYEGHLIWVKKIHTGEKEDVLDEFNPDKKLKSRSIKGMKLFYGFSFDKDEWSGGKIYDPDSGKTYSSYFYLKGNDLLKLRGYVGIPLFGKTSEWTRVKDKDRFIASVPIKNP